MKSFRMIIEMVFLLMYLSTPSYMCNDYCTMNLLSVAAIKYHLLQVLLCDECCYVCQTYTTSMYSSSLINIEFFTT